MHIWIQWRSESDISVPTIYSYIFFFRKILLYLCLLAKESSVAKDSFMLRYFQASFSQCDFERDSLYPEGNKVQHIEFLSRQELETIYLIVILENILWQRNASSQTTECKEEIRDWDLRAKIESIMWSYGDGQSRLPPSNLCIKDI